MNTATATSTEWTSPVRTWPDTPIGRIQCQTARLWTLNQDKPGDRSPYVDACERQKIEPAEDNDIGLLGEDLAEVFAQHAIDSGDLSLVATTTLTTFRSQMLGLAQMEGSRPMDFRRGLPRSERLALLAASETQWLASIAKALLEAT